MWNCNTYFQINVFHYNVPQIKQQQKDISILVKELQVLRVLLFHPSSYRGFGCNKLPLSANKWRLIVTFLYQKY